MTETATTPCRSCAAPLATDDAAFCAACGAAQTPPAPDLGAALALQAQLSQARRAKRNRDLKIWGGAGGGVLLLLIIIGAIAGSSGSGDSSSSDTSTSAPAGAPAPAAPAPKPKPLTRAQQAAHLAESISHHGGGHKIHVTCNGTACNGTLAGGELSGVMGARTEALDMVGDAFDDVYGHTKATRLDLVLNLAQVDKLGHTAAAPALHIAITRSAWGKVDWQGMKDNGQEKNLRQIAGIYVEIGNLDS